MSDPALMDPAVETTPPAAETTPPPTGPTGPLADLILVRLLPATKSVPPKKLREDVAPLFHTPPSDEQVAETLTALRSSGLLTPKGQLSTATGRARALEYLGVSELPPRANWGMMKARYLVPKALGLSANAEDTAKVVGDANKLAPLLLKRKLGLPVGTGTTLNAVFEAITCRELGFPDHVTLKSLIPVLLGKAIEGDGPIEAKDAEKVVPRVLLGAKQGGMNGLREVALTGWIGGDEAPKSEPTATPAEPFDLEGFANTVKSEARRCPTGRFGDNKVFINHVWGQLKDEPRFAPLGLDGFKEKLVEAHRQDLLTLSRADLVQLMDPADVRESETAYLNAVFHFVLVEKE